MGCAGSKPAKSLVNPDYNSDTRNYFPKEEVEAALTSIVQSPPPTSPPISPPTSPPQEEPFVAKPGAQLRATLLIQRWYRKYQAELELRRQCTWTIFQTMEYANENEQLKLYNFFNEIISGLPEALTAMQNDKAQEKDGVVEKEFFSKLANPKYVTLESDYKGPVLTLPLTIDKVTDCIERFKKGEVLHAKYALTILGEVRKVFQKTPNVQHTTTAITGKITVVGDLHGKLDDLCMIFFKNGLPGPDNPYIFNGDFVDRGANSIEVSLVLFCFVILYPEYFFINRGNHEDVIMNKRYGFTTEVVKKYGVLANRITKGFEGVFRTLPLIMVVDQAVLICHGGVSDITDLEYINGIDRERYASILRPPVKANKDPHLEDEIDLIEWRQMLDLLWSDPKAAPGCEPNTFRGGGTYFGPDITQEILDKHGLKLLIRSHECKPNGYEVTHGGKVVTIFSASNYYEIGSNLGAYIKLPSNHKPQFIQFSSNEKTSNLPLATRVGFVESSALRDLRGNIFANQGVLTTAFKTFDPEDKGIISAGDWADTLGRVLCLDLPWRTLRPKIVEQDENGFIKYLTSFDDVRLEDNSASIDNAQLTETIYRQRKTLETIFRILDTDNSGVLSTEELREGCALLTKHTGAIPMSEKDLDDLVDAMDMNRDGSINFNEFLESFRLVDSKFTPSQSNGGLPTG